MKKRLCLMMVILLLGINPTRAAGEVMIAGRDLGVPIYGSSLLVYGDTTDQLDIHGGPAYTKWPNSIGKRSGRVVTPIANGIWAPIPPGLTSTPTGGMKIGSCLYVWNMNVSNNDGDIFYVTSSGLAVSCDGGATWAERLLFDGATLFSQVTPYGKLVNGDVYLLGTMGGRWGQAILARVPAGQVISSGAYQFWNGHAWGSLAEAVPILDGSVGELSISYNTYLRRYLVIYQCPLCGGVVYRTAPAFTGPWSTSTVIIPQQGSRFYAPEQLEAVTGQVVEYGLSDYDIYSVIWVELRLP